MILFISEDKRSKNLAKAERHLFSTCVLLVVMYFISMTFNFAIWILYYIDSARFEHLFNSWTFHISQAMVIFNCVCNPFIYTIRYYEFQECLMHFFNLKKNI